MTIKDYNRLMNFVNEMFDDFINLKDARNKNLEWANLASKFGMLSNMLTETFTNF